MYKVLIIEDDNMIGEMLSMYLSEEGYQVRRADNGKDGMNLLLEFLPDIVLLDLVLPDINGTQLCSDFRKASAVPILVVSMKTDVADRIQALDAGADGYLIKPFSMRELTAKVAAMIRRLNLNQRYSDKQNQSDYDGQQASVNLSEDSPEPLVAAIHLDLERRSIHVNQEYVETTFSEFEIMKLFYSNQEKVFSREELINILRGFDSLVTDRAIDVHIANLRKKIELDPKEPQHIKTVWGIGYKFQMRNAN
jgi:DNA-binding response OmpR family regulator